MNTHLEKVTIKGKQVEVFSESVSVSSFKAIVPSGTPSGTYYLHVYMGNKLPNSKTETGFFGPYPMSIFHSQDQDTVQELMLEHNGYYFKDGFVAVLSTQRYKYDPL